MPMSYNPEEIIRSYTRNAEIEDQSEKQPSLRTEIPREFIKRYIVPTDITLDAGGGVGINAMMMAGLCKSVTLLDITPEILTRARANINDSGFQDSIRILEGDICDLSSFEDGSFSFIVCVGDALSYVLDQRERAIAELVRVAKSGSILILGGDSKTGFMRLRLAEGKLDEALDILDTDETTCGMGPRTHLYTASEMRSLLESSGCRILEAASTPSLSDTIDTARYTEMGRWEELKTLEMEICTKPELLGTGLHLLFVAQKE